MLNIFNNNLNKGENIIINNIRHFKSIRKSYIYLKKAYNNLLNNNYKELISIDLNNSLNFLKEITGEITNEDILKNIFENFCIGK